MASSMLTCPYCNSLVPAPEHPPQGGRLLCPRCGEAFPYRPLGTDQAGESHPAVAAPAPGPVLDTPVWRWSNGAVAAVVLALMALLATVSLTFSLLTVQDRRNYVPQQQHPPDRIAIAIQANRWVVVLAGAWTL